MSKDLKRRSVAGALLAVPAWAQNRPSATTPPTPAPNANTSSREGEVILGRDGWLFGAWEDIRRVDLRRTRELCHYVKGAVGIMQAAGLKVALCVTPTKARTYQEFLPADFQPNADATARYDAIMDELSGGEVMIANHAAQFADLRRTSRDALFFKADIHWTPAGGAAAAAELAKLVRERAALPAPRKPGTRLGDYISMRYESNDLAGMLPPATRSRFPFEQFRVRRILGAPQGIGLIDEDGADTVVIGNSFMQTGFGFPPAFSNQLNRAVSLAVQVGRFGPYTTLLNYLKSDLFKNERPRLLVWHFLEGNMEVMPDHNGYWGSAAMPSALFTSELRRLVTRT